MTEIKIGTVVQLKSGGPHMTVTSQGTSPGYAYCEWFTGDGKRDAATFHRDALDVIEDETLDEVE